MNNPFKRQKPNAFSAPEAPGTGLAAADPKPKRSRRILLIVLIAAAAVIAGLAVYKKSRPSLTSISTGTVNYGDLTKTISADGTVASRNVSVVSDTTGSIVQSVDVSLNNTVNRGARLCTLKDSETGALRAVTAPISGTVTHVGAVKGSPASGELFTLQDTGNLKVIMNIDQSDIGAVSTGQAVTITANGTGGKTYHGVVASVAPTSTASAAAGDSESAAVSSSGSAASSAAVSSAAASSDLSSASSGGSTPQFSASADISAPADGLKIGMKTHQDITVETRRNIFTVPIDAVTKDANGHYEIFVVRHHKDQPDTVEAVKVTTGLQNDTIIEISAKGLKAGAKVALNPASLKDGEPVTA
jgi:multidrug efflux pump subunit AcrA (membrane-fusion protein)